MHRFDPVMRPFHTPNLGGNGLGASLGQGPSVVSFGVRDGDDNAIPGATITITHGDRSRSWKTDEKGNLDITNLAINAGDPFRLEVSASGYKTRVYPQTISMPGLGMIPGRQILQLQKAGVSPELIGVGLLAAVGLGYVLFG